jgi:hypothetical protein
MAAQVKTDRGRGGLSVEKVRGHCLSEVLSQRFPVVGLSEYRLAKALGNKAAVRFLGDFKDDFHSLRLCQWQTIDKPISLAPVSMTLGRVFSLLFPATSIKVVKTLEH